MMMNPDGTVSILLAEYLHLLQAKHMLDALEEAGVDNWEGYCRAFDILDRNELEKKNV